MTAARASFATGGVALVEFARALTAASNLQELEQAFAPRAGRLMASPMYGFYALDGEGARIEHKHLRDPDGYKLVFFQKN